MDGVWSMKATSFSEIPEMAGLPYALIPDNCHIEKEKMGPRRGNRRRTQFSKIWWPSFVLHWGRHLWCYACLWIFVIFKRFFKDSFFKLYNFFFFLCIPTPFFLTLFGFDSKSLFSLLHVVYIWITWQHTFVYFVSVLFTLSAFVSFISVISSVFVLIIFLAGEE